MKKLLLATTILGMTAGFAAAEVKLSGSAAMGVGRDGEGSGDLYKDAGYHIYSSGELDVAATAVTDAGVEFGMSTSVSFGTSYSFADDDGFAAEDGTIGAPTLTAKGKFGTVTFADDGIDMLYDDATAGDFGYNYSVGALSLDLVYDVDGTTSAEPAVDNNMDWSATAAYTVSGVALSVTGDANDSYTASAAYTMGAITGTLETDSDATVVDGEAVNTLTVAYAKGPISAEASTATDDTWSVSLGYAVNSMSVDISTDDADAWEATASYDLGGGAKFVGGANYAEDGYAGVELSF